ncbi:trypsin-like peptidase domain-containing protein [Ureibacillus aquaedulcis]|uniref:Trypsin-like peptidase domain-containing protein n=1 Tax=Ureibacillus aquaedulcis TaxID=3058421 RepID=A0ABT8GUP2_9BACL|nr:trypsin-like peptidase domain-containing protein [Ureibacillus sp. BA0131]MDN4495094.1 trypsin-like peptidase domain-containing protein [Ureibacillus sp. BA0131]
MYCSNCGSKLEAEAKFCNACGQNTHNNRSKKTWLIFGVITSLITIVFIGFAIASFITNTKQETAIEENTEKDSATPSQTPLENQESQKEKTQIIKESMPKVFTILTTDGQGSGFLYQDGGYIVTNAHVVAGYTDVTVRNHDGEESPAKVIGVSNISDVAILKSEEYAQTAPLLLEMEQTDIGTEVIAIGSPQGFENSASIGYLTGTERNIEYDFVYEELYQFDAQIDQGSSGGPLLDATTGKVIGINSLLYTYNASFGFSIPLYKVADLINEWITTPMNETQIAEVYDAYHEFIYSEPAAEGEDAYYDDYYEEDYGGNYTFDEESLSNFVIAFRDYYESALYYEDFYWIQDMLVPDSTVYWDLEAYINEIAGQGNEFYFISNTITDVEIFEDYAIVTSNEEVDFYDALGDYTYFNNDVEYTVVITEDGYYQIKEVTTLN